MSEGKIPYVDFGPQVAPLKAKLLEVVGRVLDSGTYVLGPEVSAFEAEFAAYCGAKFASGIANGTCALHLVLRGCGIGEGDEVITAPNSFIASASSIALAGARPVFADVADDLNLDPARIEDAITPRTKAIMPVHLTGRLARMPEILEIARRRKLFVLEDAAQAVGASFDGKKAGAWGDAACFSLHPLKNLHAFGDGGMMTTSDTQVIERMTKARNHGLKNRNECEFWSYNCRLDEIQAAMLRVQLEHLDRMTDERRKLAFAYNDALRGVVTVPDEKKGEHHVYQTYVVLADRRDELLAHLNSRGIDAKVHYPLPLYDQEPARELGYTARDFPMTARLSKRILSLPLYPGLTSAQQGQIIETITKFYRR